MKLKVYDFDEMEKTLFILNVYIFFFFNSVSEVLCYFSSSPSS